MNIQFNIKKLGAITDSTFAFRPFMIFSGESSLGKSYSAFLTYYFISLFTNDRLRPFFDQVYQNQGLAKKLDKNGVLNITVNIKDLQRWINFKSSEFIGYLIGNSDFKSDVEIKFEMSDLKITFEIEKALNSDNNLTPQELILIKIEDELFTANISSKTDLPKLISQVLSIVFKKKLFDKDFNYHTMFLPPSRAALIGVNFTSANEIMASAGMYKEFINDMEILNSVTEEKYRPSKIITKILADLFGGKIHNEKGILFYECDDLKIPITSAASSIKELAPLSLLLNKFKPQDFSVLFEEPEAHTHPKMQVKIANVIGQLVKEGAFFQVTTHSDYFLNQINNLVRLHKIKQQTNPKRFSSFCEDHKLDKSYTLDPKLIGAYYFKRREDNSVEIVVQDPSNGVPFDTFENTVDKLMLDSSIIEEQLESKR